MTLSTPKTEHLRGTVASMALVAGVVAAGLTFAICLLLGTTALQLKRSDPLNNSTLLELRTRYAEGEQGETIKQEIRALDLLSRQAFFTSRSQIQHGGRLALLSAVVMLLAMGLYRQLTWKIAVPTGKVCEGGFWSSLERSRVWIGGGAVMLVAAAVVLALATPTALTPAMAQAPVDAPAPVDPGSVPTHLSPTLPPALPPALPAGFAQQSPAFRGPYGNGLTDCAGIPTAWDERTGRNILWKQKLELPGWAAPVVWERRLFVTGADVSRRLVSCLDLDTGAPLWTTTVPPPTDTRAPYVPDTMDERWNSLVLAGATPAVNGSQLFALFSNGQLVALDVTTGAVLWHHLLGDTSENTFGLDNSLLIYRDTVIVAFQGEERFLACYAGATGQPLWRTERHQSTWSSPVLAELAEGSHAVVLTAEPNVSAWDAATGAPLWSTAVLTGGVEFCVGPSAVVVDDHVYVNCQNSGIYSLRLADGGVAWSLTTLPDDSGFPDGVSMTTDGRHLFQFYESVLTAVELSTGRVVLQEEMEEFGNYASPIVNQGKLYLLSDQVTTVVEADPAGGFAVVGQGTLLESSDTCPAVVPGRLLLRSDQSLYCIGEQP